MKNPCPGLWLADIQEQTKHLTSLTNNLITLSRMEEERTRLQMIDFPFSDVVEETVKSFQALARTQNKTFETSIQPYEDCCTVFTPRHPRTKPRLAMLEEAEAALDAEALIEEAVAGVRRKVI